MSSIPVLSEKQENSSLLPSKEENSSQEKPSTSIFKFMSPYKEEMLDKNHSLLSVYIRLPAFVAYFMLASSLFYHIDFLFQDSTFKTSGRLAANYIQDHILEDYLRLFFETSKAVPFIVLSLFLAANLLSIAYLFSNHLFLPFLSKITKPFEAFVGVYLYAYIFFILPIFIRISEINLFYTEDMMGPYQILLILSTILLWVSSIPLAIYRKFYLFNFHPFNKDAMASLAGGYIDSFYLFFHLAFTAISIFKYSITFDYALLACELLSCAMTYGLLFCFVNNYFFWKKNTLFALCVVYCFYSSAAVQSSISLILKLTIGVKLELSFFLFIFSIIWAFHIKILYEVFIWKFEGQIYSLNLNTQTTELSLIFFCLLTLQALPKTRKAKDFEKNKSFRNQKASLFIDGFVSCHMRTCKDSECVCHNRSKLFFLFADCSSSDKTEIFDDNILKIHLIVQLMGNFEKKKGKKASSISVYKALVMCSFLGYIHQSFNVIQNSVKLHGIRSPFLFYSIMKEIRNFSQMKYHNQLFNPYWEADYDEATSDKKSTFLKREVEDFDVCSIMNYHQSLKEMVKKIKEATIITVSFFKKLSNEKIPLHSLILLNQKQMKLERAITILYVKLQSFDLSLVGDIILFMAYLKIIRNKKSSGQKLVQVIERKLRINAFKKIQDDKDMTSYFIFDRKSCVVGISGQREDLATIYQCTSNVEVVFGFKEEELCHNTINICMSPIFRYYHDIYMTFYLNTGKEVVLNNKREVFGLKKDGYCFPMRIYVKLNPQIKAGVRYLAYLRRIKATAGFIITYQNGVIDSLQEEISQLIKMDARNFINKPIFDLIPELREAYEALDYQLFKKYIKNPKGKTFRQHSSANIPVQDLDPFIFARKEHFNLAEASAKTLDNLFFSYDYGSQNWKSVPVRVPFIDQNKSSMKSNASSNSFEKSIAHFKKNVNVSMLDLVFKESHVLRAVIFSLADTHYEILGMKEYQKNLDADSPTTPRNSLKSVNSQSFDYDPDHLSFDSYVRNRENQKNPKEKSEENIKGGKSNNNNLEPVRSAGLRARVTRRTTMRRASMIVPLKVNNSSNAIRSSQDNSPALKEALNPKPKETVNQKIRRITRELIKSKNSSPNVSNSRILSSGKTNNKENGKDLSYRWWKERKINQEKEDQSSKGVTLGLHERNSVSSVRSLHAVFLFRNIEEALVEAPPVHQLNFLLVLMLLFQFVIGGIISSVIYFQSAQYATFIEEYELLILSNQIKMTNNQIMARHLLLLAERNGNFTDSRNFTTKFRYESAEDFSKKELIHLTEDLFDSIGLLANPDGSIDSAFIQSWFEVATPIWVLDSENQAVYQEKSLYNALDLLAVSGVDVANSPLSSIDPSENFYSFYIANNTMNGIASRNNEEASNLKDHTSSHIESISTMVISFFFIIVFFSLICFGVFTCFFYQIQQLIFSNYRVLTHLKDNEVIHSIKLAVQLEEALSEAETNEDLLISHLFDWVKYIEREEKDPDGTQTHRWCVTFDYNTKFLVIKYNVFFIFLYMLGVCITFDLYFFFIREVGSEFSEKIEFLFLFVEIFIGNLTTQSWIFSLFSFGSNSSFLMNSIPNYYNEDFQEILAEMEKFSSEIDKTSESVYGILYENACEFGVQTDNEQLACLNSANGVAKDGIIYVFSYIMSLCNDFYLVYTSSEAPLSSMLFESSDYTSLIELTEFVLIPNSLEVISFLENEFISTYHLARLVFWLVGIILLLVSFLVGFLMMRLIYKWFLSQIQESKQILLFFPIQIIIQNAYFRQHLEKMSPKALAKIR